MSYIGCDHHTSNDMRMPLVHATHTPHMQSMHMPHICHAPQSPALCMCHLNASVCPWCPLHAAQASNAPDLRSKIYYTETIVMAVLTPRDRSERWILCSQVRAWSRSTRSAYDALRPGIIVRVDMPDGDSPLFLHGNITSARCCLSKCPLIGQAAVQCAIPLFDSVLSKHHQ